MAALIPTTRSMNCSHCPIGKSAELDASVYSWTFKSCKIDQNCNQSVPSDVLKLARKCNATLATLMNMLMKRRHPESNLEAADSRGQNSVLTALLAETFRGPRFMVNLSLYTLYLQWEESLIRENHRCDLQHPTSIADWKPVSTGKCFLTCP